MAHSIDEAFDFIEETTAKFNIKKEFAVDLYRHFRGWFQPPVLRTAMDVLKEAWEEMERQMGDIELGDDVDLDRLMVDNGLDPKVRSDHQRTLKFFRDSGLVQLQRGTPARWIKGRLTDDRGTDDRGNGTTAPPTTEDGTTAPPTAED
jgi:hypothetical protein